MYLQETLAIYIHCGTKTIILAVRLTVKDRDFINRMSKLTIKTTHIIVFI